MKNYSVIPMFMDHVDEIVEDIKLQYDKGIAVCPLFITKIHPEGTPPIDKTTKICNDFAIFKEKLDKLGVPAGFLAQSTFGHGYPLDNGMSYTPFTSLDDGSTGNMYCPLDSGFREYIKGAMKAMREGIDEIDPTIQGIVCNTGGDICEFAKVLGPVFAGKGNPSIVRIGGGSYSPASTNGFSGMLCRVAANRAQLKDHIDILLAEGDTIPFNRYGRNKSYYHSQMTMYTLHGCKGSKLWITRLATHEPKSGKIFREALGDNMPFYNELIRIAPDIEWIGCNCPFESSDVFDFHIKGETRQSWMFAMKVLERMGLPLYFSNKPGKANFISGNCTSRFSEKFLNDIFEGGSVFLSSDCLEALTERGYTDRIGVISREWKGANISGEQYKNAFMGKQIKQKELVPVNDKVYAHSVSYHLENNVDKVPLFPAVSVLEREGGKRTVVFAGTPDTEFNYAEAFSFLCETRKNQLIELLKECDAIPVYYTEDAEIFLNAGYMGKDKMVVAPFNLGWDVLDEFPIFFEHNIKKIEKINADGSYSEVEFTKDGDNYVIKQELGSLIPQVFILHI